LNAIYFFEGTAHVKGNLRASLHRLVVRLTPPEVLVSARAQAQQVASRPISYTAATFFVVLWLVVLFVIARWVVSVVST
jgi:hypothetical protein